MTVIGFGTCWVKAIKDKQMCLNKQQLKDSGIYLLWNCYSTVDPKILSQIIGIPIRSYLAPFFTNHFFQFMKVSGWMR